MSGKISRKKLKKKQRIFVYLLTCIFIIWVVIFNNFYNNSNNVNDINDVNSLASTNMLDSNSVDENINEDNINENSFNENSSNEDGIENANLINEKLNSNSEQSLKVMFLYVGQADCTFIKIGDECILIDAGNNEDGKNITDFLKSIGVNKIDYLIGTHNHEDHIGGMDDVVQNFDIGNLYLSNVNTDVANYKNVKEQASKKNIEITNPKVGDKFSVGETECEIMSAESKKDTTPNNSSIVVQMTYKNKKILFMGDAEKEVEESKNWNKVDVLKVGHHGSATSSTKNFLKEIQPEYAFIEVGKNNSYRLPNKYVISRLMKMVKNVYRTDTNKSSFVLTCDGDNISVHEENINLDGNPEE